MVHRIKQSAAYRNPDTVEPGLFHIFRIYMVFFDVIVIANAVMLVISDQVAEYPAFFPIVAVLVALNFLLFFKPFQQKRGPFVLALSLAAYIVITILLLWSQLDQSPPMDMIGWGEFYFRFGFTTLFIPFLIAAWQFGLPGTLAFILLTTLFEGSVYVLTLEDISRYFSMGFTVFRSINFFIIGVIISRLMLAQRRQRYELEKANQQLTHYATTLEQLAVSRERNRLARELHDTLAHTLSGVSVQLEAVRALWEAKPQEAHNMLDQALSDTRSGLSDTRRALENLRAEPLEDLGLILALERLCSSFYDRTGVELELELPEEINLSASAQHGIYRTVQEALTNIDRHAGASLVQVSLLPGEGRNLTLTVRDDGVGFDWANHPEEGHFGLRGIRERAELLGAGCEIDSAPGTGTVIVLHLKEEAVTA